MRDVKGKCHSGGLVSYVAFCSAINFRFIAWIIQTCYSNNSDLVFCGP
jgi:hypothetical protein